MSTSSRSVAITTASSSFAVAKHPCSPISGDFGSDDVDDVIIQSTMLLKEFDRDLENAVMQMHGV